MQDGPLPQTAPDATAATASTPETASLPPHRRKLSPEEINQKELITYTGPIHIIRNQEDLAPALALLQKETLLGFDTEKRPSFRKGEFHPPAVLQLAGEHTVFLFHLTFLGLPPELASILADPHIVKAGVAVDRDVKELRDMSHFHPANFIDLGVCAKNAGLQHHGLRGLASVLLSCRISKKETLTNWSRPQLPSSAWRYAATDAWIGRRIYQAMKELDCLILTPPPKPSPSHPPHGNRQNKEN